MRQWLDLRTILRNQRGDTLVEITIALAILSFVLLSSFNLASFSFRLGQMAKERTQGVQLAQEQAEALRNFRDNSSWANFNSGAVGTFHFEKQSGVWAKIAGNYQPLLNSQGTPFLVNIERLGDVIINAGPPIISVNSYRVTSKWAPLAGQSCPLNGSGVRECTVQFLTNLGRTDDLAPVAN